MESGIEELRIRRIVACFAPGSMGAPESVARLARDLQAELLGLFIEDIGLLRFAALPFAVEVGFPSAVRRNIDIAGLERQLRSQAEGLRQALAAVLEPAPVAWSFRVERASPARAIAQALAEDYTPMLLIPPGGNPRAERQIVRRAELSEEALRALLRALRPVLILPA